MLGEYRFVRVDASSSPALQQREVRQLLQEHVDLPRYRWKILPEEILR
jgi:hypothetical protein